jgi:hypothetical protein
MSDISGLSDQEKSVMLARAMGWEFSRHECGEGRWSWGDENGYQIGGSLHDDVVKVADDSALSVAPMLYSPARMALAWRVLNWISGADSDKEIDEGSLSNVHAWLRFHRWWTERDNFLVQESPADAQRAWLDKILSLCIEAGLVEVGDD